MLCEVVLPRPLKISRVTAREGLISRAGRDTEPGLTASMWNAWHGHGNMRLTRDLDACRLCPIMAIARNSSGGPSHEVLEAARRELANRRVTCSQRIASLSDRERELAELALLFDDRSLHLLGEAGELLRGEGRLDDAERCFRKAVGVAETLGKSLLDRCYAYLRLGRVLVESGKAAEAEQWLRRAAEIAAGEECVNLGTRSLISSELSKALVAHGKDGEAAEWAGKAEAIMEEIRRVARARADRASATWEARSSRPEEPKERGGRTGPARAGLGAFETVLRRTADRPPLPLPDAFERNCLAVLKEGSQPMGRQELYEQLCRRKEVRAEIDEYKFLAQADRAMQRGFLSAAERPAPNQGRGKRATRMSVRRSASARIEYSLAAEPIELFVRICRSVIRPDPLTAQVSAALEELARLLLPAELRKAFPKWLKVWTDHQQHNDCEE